ncbi:CAP domain-containing protein [Aspergillus pseudodeflectus]|uniref:CAP domain-containing protein n=1 Tax=Aspergillus pseudodeflectus TaxID=176178 RepID=A0ABR4K1P9_9EURO
MRSSIILSALCALGAMAEIEPAYVTTWTTTTVTDWTVITITKTITVQPTTEATVEPTSAPATEVKVQEPEPEPVEVERTTTTTQAPAPVETSWSSTWTSTWESTWTATQEPETTTTTTSEATQAPAPTTNTYQGNVLYSHNVHRANHSSTDLTWSSDLEASAQALAASCVYQHDTSINGGGYGQNIGYGVSSDEVAVMISNLMYNDEAPYFENLYGQASPDMSLFEKWGHFSQIVWKGTTQVGCATVVCNSLGNVDSATAVPFTVCNYSPPGNYDGEYADNIARPLGNAAYSA